LDAAATTVLRITTRVLRNTTVVLHVRCDRDASIRTTEAISEMIV
jgi:hypothetical protein